MNKERATDWKSEAGKKLTVEATFREIRRRRSYLFCPLDSGLFGASDFQSVAAYFDVTRGPSEPTPQQVATLPKREGEREGAC